MKGMLMMIGIQQRLPPKKRATNKYSVMWKLFVVSKLTQYKMEGFYVDSHGSLHHGDLELILCFKGMICTAINLWSTYILPMVSNIAIYNLRDGGLDAQLAPSVVKFNTIHTCDEVKVSNTHIGTKSSTKRKRKRCVGSIKRLFKRSKPNIEWLTLYVNANSLKLPYETKKNERCFIVPHIVEKEVLLVCYGTVTFSIVKFISIKEKLMHFLNDTCPELFTHNAKKYANSIFDLIHSDSSYKTRMLMCTPCEYDSVKCTGNVIETSWKEKKFFVNCHLYQITSWQEFQYQCG